MIGWIIYSSKSFQRGLISISFQMLVSHIKENKFSDAMLEKKAWCCFYYSRLFYATLKFEIKSLENRISELFVFLIIFKYLDMKRNNLFVILHGFFSLNFIS